MLEFTVPTTPPRRCVKGGAQCDASGSGCGPGAVVLTTVCAAGGILLTMQTVSHTSSMPDLEKIALSALASVFFVVLSHMLLTFGPTRNHGRILVDRIRHAPQNWEEETLRSFVETGTWLCVCWLTADATGNWPLALLCATVSSWVMILLGEMATTRYRAVEERLRQVWGEDALESQYKASGSSFLLCLYGYGILNSIYAHVQDIALAVLLSGLTGVLLIVTAKLLAAWPPTRRAGLLIEERITDSLANWRDYPLRSATEACSFVGIILGVYASHYSLTLAVQAGAFSGMVVCLVGELFAPSEGQGEDRSAWMVPLCVCAYSIVIGLHTVFTQAPLLLGRQVSLGEQLLLGTAGAGFMHVTGRLFLRYESTRKVGRVIQDRLSGARFYWGAFPVRTSAELLGTLALTWATWSLTGSVRAVILCSLLCFCGVVLLSEFIQLHFAVLWLWIVERPSQAVQMTVRQCIELAFGCAWLQIVAWKVLIWRSGRLTILNIPVPGPLTRIGWGGGATGAGDSGKLVKPAKPTKPPPLDVTVPAIAARATRDISRTELSRHCTDDDMWLAVHGGVYDITAWHHRHPGGVIIREYAGIDATDQFELFHSAAVAPRLRPFLIGRLVDDAPTDADTATTATANAADSANSADAGDAAMSGHAAAAGAACTASDIAAAAVAAADPCTLEYRELRRRLWEEGAFAPRTSFYALKQTLIAGLVGSALFLLACCEGTAARLGLAPVLLGIGLQQAAFLAHDTMHNGVFARRGDTRGREQLGQLNAGVLLGISVQMWLKEHSEHHSYTLRPHADPQFLYFPFWLQSLKEVPLWKAELPCALHARKLLWKGVRLLTRMQHLTFLPIVFVIGRVNFIGISWVFALKGRHGRDAAAMGLHLLWYTALLGLAFSDARERLLFTLVHYVTVGILHIQLLLSHLSTVQLTPPEERALGLFKAQLAATRNISSCWYSHWFHGGLEMQIEHHLFPQLPRHELRAVAPRVRALAAKHGVAYVESGFWEALAHCLRDLRALSTALATVDFV